MRSSDSKHPDKGSLVYHFRSSPHLHRHCHEMDLREDYHFHSPDGIRYGDSDQAALLWKIDELKHQLDRVTNNLGSHCPSDGRKIAYPPYSFDPHRHAHKTSNEGCGGRHDFLPSSYPLVHKLDQLRVRDSCTWRMQSYSCLHQHCPGRGRHATSNSRDPCGCCSGHQILQRSCPQRYDSCLGVAAPVPPDAFKNPFCNGSKSHPFHNHERQGPMPPYNCVSNSQMHNRQRGDFTVSRTNGYAKSILERLESRKKSICHPIAGAAPFLTCHYCFGLLQLPKKLGSMANVRKIRCGACSASISIAICDKKLAVSFVPETKEAEIFHDDSSTTEKLMDEGQLQLSGIDNRGSDNFFYTKNSGFKCPAVYEQPVAMSRAAGDTWTSVCSSSSRSCGNAPVQGLLPNAVEEEIGKGKLSGNFSRSIGSDEHEHDGAGAASGVSVNGRVIPDSFIKKAEKYAGPIQPGDYWYDLQGGFWGAMGGPCLGIIPPFIQGFKYPIAQDCAGGTTGILVNGRELHEEDLDLLSARGLPVERNRSYIVEISGKVLDAETGEELDNIKNLAPTVEKMKCGFGMKVPNTRNAGAKS